MNLSWFFPNHEEWSNYACDVYNLRTFRYGLILARYRRPTEVWPSNSFRQETYKCSLGLLQLEVKVSHSTAQVRSFFLIELGTQPGTGKLRIDYTESVNYDQFR